MENLLVTNEVDANAQTPEKIEGEEIKDGHYYLKLCSKQVEALEKHAEMAEKELSSCQNKEACGFLRAAAGKARLLVANKLNQFKELCIQNIEQSSTGDFPVMNEDLAGFWDMVMIQVEEVISECNRIDKSSKNKKNEEKRGKTSMKEENNQLSSAAMETKSMIDNRECKNSELRTCENCHTRIKGQAVYALGKVWHPEHFICAACKKPISGQVFNLHQGKPFCEQDYNKLLNKCRACGLPIKNEQTIQALGSSWHKDHFVCTSCSSPLAGQGFYERENSPFCQKCFESRSLPKCAVCDQLIIGAVMMALGKSYHPGCLKCAECNKVYSSDGGPFQVVDNEVICTSCASLALLH